MKEYICEYCGKIHSGEYGSGRFCSSSCARKFSTSKDNPSEQKVVYCTICNKPVKINKRASSINFICNDCKEIKKEVLRTQKRIEFISKKCNQLSKYRVDTSPYKDFDTVYENVDSFGDKYLYFTKHDSTNKIVERCKVYLYRYNIEYTLKRRLQYNEVIHHIDFNHFNNDIDNLIVVSRPIHNKLHSNKISIEEVLENGLFVFRPTS